jgi:hypothetical protein
MIKEPEAMKATANIVKEPEKGMLFITDAEIFIV